jgi:hypothetical protein
MVYKTRILRGRKRGKIMKIINLGRGQGKTTRLLYASEFNDMPILCTTNAQKSFLIEQAKIYGLKIPEPITVSDIMSSNKLRGSDIIYKEILIDEAPLILQTMLNNLGMHGGVRAITLTSDELK